MMSEAEMAEVAAAYASGMIEQGSTFAAGDGCSYTLEQVVREGDTVSLRLRGVPEKVLIDCTFQVG